MQLQFAFAGAIIFLVTATSSDHDCNRQLGKIKHRFYALRHCQRSNRTVIGRTNLDNARQCADFARQHQGMAFNFAPKGRNSTNLFDILRNHTQNAPDLTWKMNKETNNLISEEEDEFYNCQVLDCPEYQNLSTIVNDTRFDYYSMYTRPAPSGNATCLPAIGVFMAQETMLNYSAAYNSCALSGGSLAHVASDLRTLELSKFISEMKGNETTMFYVGLNETTLNKFRTSANERLNCFLFRAWAPGHPANRQPGCVGLTGDGMWMVHNCNRKLPYICEIHTSGPPLYEARLKRKCSVKRPNNRIAPRRKP